MTGASQTSKPTTNMQAAGSAPRTGAAAVPPTPRRARWQFGLSTLLVGMFVFAIFFGYSGWWSQRMARQQMEHDLRLREMQAKVEAQAQVIRGYEAQTRILESQLKDSVEVRFSEQLSGRETAESDLQAVEIVFAKLREDYEAAQAEIASLKEQLEQAKKGGRGVVENRER